VGLEQIVIQFIGRIDLLATFSDACPNIRELNIYSSSNISIPASVLVQLQSLRHLKVLKLCIKDAESLKLVMSTYAITDIPSKDLLNKFDFICRF
jgi:hypothetical protein